MSITSSQTAKSEIVLSERVVTTDYKIVQIQESIKNRFVEVQIELGPFVTEDGPGGPTQTRGSSMRNIQVWHNEEYDAIRDTWTNADLIAAVATKI
jgi:hypothetical protein